MSNHNHIGALERILHGLSWRLPSWLFGYDHSFLMGGRELKLPVRNHADYVVRPATLDDVSAMKAAGFRESLFRHRIRRGDHCILVFKGDRVVSWSWSATGQVFVMLQGAVVDMGEEDFYLYDVYTVPEERLRGLIMNCFEKQLEHHHGCNRYNILATISAFNFNSLSSHFRMGFKVCGETYCLTLAGVSLCYTKSWPYPTRKVHVFFRHPPADMKSV